MQEVSTQEGSINLSFWAELIIKVNLICRILWKIILFFLWTITVMCDKNRTWFFKKTINFFFFFNFSNKCSLLEGKIHKSRSFDSETQNLMIGQYKQWTDFHGDKMGVLMGIALHQFLFLPNVFSAAPCPEGKPRNLLVCRKNGKLGSK